jgi:hypothetical protein
VAICGGGTAIIGALAGNAKPSTAPAVVADSPSPTASPASPGPGRDTHACHPNNCRCAGATRPRSPDAPQAGASAANHTAAARPLPASRRFLHTRRRTGLHLCRDADALPEISDGLAATLA